MENRKINVQIVQPVVPKYRIPLFDDLINDDRFNVSIMAGMAEPGGVRSLSASACGADYRHEINAIFIKFLWQKNVHLLPEMGRGDVLIVNGNIKVLSNYHLMLEAKRNRVAVVWWGHGWSATTNLASYFVRKYFMKHLPDSLLLYTEREKEMLLEDNFDCSRIFFINNTVDRREIEKAKSSVTLADLDNLRKRNGLIDKKILLFVGRLRSYPRTDLEIAIMALGLLGSSYQLVVVGDGGEKDYLRKFAISYGVVENISFVGSIYDEDELAPWFLCSDCFVYPGSIGLSLLHSFSYGLPVVTNDALRKHGPEIAALKDGENGKLFVRGDVEDFVSCVKLIEDDKLYFSRNALQTVSDEFSFEKAVERFSDCIIYSSKIYSHVAR